MGWIWKGSGRILNLWYRGTRSFRMTTPRHEKAMESLQKNPYYEKYAQRISELQRVAPDEFLERVGRALPPERAAQPGGAAVDTRQYSSVLNPKEQSKDNVIPRDKKLDEIFKLELVQNKDPSEIQKIWEQYHQQKEVISATIPAETYSELHARMHECPSFLLPLPRAQGYEFMLCQSHGHVVHFTPLLAFQVHKENAPECLTMVHYTELADKGIILMRGEYDKNVLNGQEAQCLANQFQMYYSGRDKVKTRLLQTFTREPDSFKHMDLINQLENIGLS